MSIRRNLGLTGCLFCVFIATDVSQAQTGTKPGSTTGTAADGTSTGQRIGNVISAAVSTAFPAVSSIIKAIWPGGGTNPVRPQQAAPGLQAAKDQSNVAQKANSDVLIAVAQNLSVVRTFVTECGFAGIQISAMQRILADRASKADLSAAEKAALSDLWNPVNKRLENVTKDTVGKSVDGMTDNFLKVTLGAIRDAITNNAGNITDQIKSGREAALSLSLSQLGPQVNGVMPLTGVLIGDLSASLATAANNVSSHAGPIPKDDRATPDRTNNMVSLKTVFGSKIK